MSEIRSRRINRGHPNEGTWPPDIGTGGSGTYHIHEGELQEGYPPTNIKKYGQAPIFFSDDMNPVRHPMTGETLTSRRAWRDTDKAYGLDTASKHEPPKSRRTENLKKLRADRQDAMKRSIEQIDAGTAPLTEEVREKCRIENDRISSALNFNAHDVAGRRNSEAGKKFRKRFRR